MNIEAIDWQPTATRENLQLRANIIKNIRDFFASRGVLEVETPLISYATATDPHLHSLTVTYTNLSQSHNLYLQTSPEFAMKRLLAAGSGPIYQICKVFRGDDQGRYHNPEFTMLEWYRPGFDHHALMDEMDALLQRVLQTASAQRLSYHDAFMHYLDIDPHHVTIAQLAACTQHYDITPVGYENADRDTWLQLLMHHCIEPHLGQSAPTFIYDYPSSQAALAKIRNDNPLVAERFEVYVAGVELANGFHELCDANEQYQRFQNDLATRKKLHLPNVPYDRRLIAALQHGLPACAGVALGVDRLVMLKAQASTLAEVISFPLDRA